VYIRNKSSLVHVNKKTLKGQPFFKRTPLEEHEICEQPVPVLEKELTIFKFGFYVNNNFFEKELAKREKLPSMLTHKISKNVHLEKISSVVQ